MKKKLLSILLAAILSMGAFAACGSTPSSSQPAESVTGGDELGTQEPDENEIDISEHVTLKWVLRIAEQPDQALVLEELNKILNEKINATLELEFIEASAYPERVKLKFAGNEEFDLLWLNSSTFSTYVSQKALLPMEDLIDVYAPSLRDVIPESFWPATEVNGSTYAITNYQNCARQYTLLLRKDLVEKYSIDTASIKTLADLEPYMAAVQEGEGDGMILFNGGLDPSYIDTALLTGIEAIGDIRTPGAVMYKNDPYTVVNQWETDEVVALYKLAREWAEKGYNDIDLILGQNQEELSKNGLVATLFATYTPGIEVSTETRYGFEPVVIRLGSPYVSTNNIQGTLTGLSFTSKNPERAMMLLELMNTDPEVYNLLVYGLEGVHYEKTGDTSIALLEDSGYVTNVPWMIGNTMNAYTLPGVDLDVASQFNKLNRESTASPLLGFYFDPEPVQTQIASCRAVIEKYFEPLAYGTYADVEATLDQMNSELRAAGMDDLIAEKQAQLDAWLANQ